MDHRHEIARQHENDIAYDGNGFTTIASGAREEKLDVVLPSEYFDWSWLIECKVTQQAGYRITKQLLGNIWNEAIAAGHRPGLALRFVSDNVRQDVEEDWIAIPVNDFYEMRTELEDARNRIQELESHVSSDERCDCWCDRHSTPL